MTEKILRSLQLDSGVSLDFIDRSNRYFGDYHRVLIEVELLCVRDGETLRLCYRKPLQRMGVASADVEREQSALITRFLETALPYMERAQYVEALVEKLDTPGQQVWSLYSRKER